MTARPDGQFLLVAGVCNAANKQHRVDRRFSDEHEERPIGLENLAVQVEGASDGHHSGGCRRFAPLLVHLQEGFVVGVGYEETVAAVLQYPWQAGFLSAEQVGQSHLLQRLLQTDAVLHPEARDGHGHCGFLHLVQPAVQFLQLQNLLHLTELDASLWQDDHHGDVLSSVRHLQQLNVVVGEVHVLKPGLLVHHVDLAFYIVADIEVVGEDVFYVELVLPLTLEVDGVDEDQHCGGVQRPFWQRVLDPVLRLVSNPVVDGDPGLVGIIPEVKRQQLGSVHRFADVLVGFVKGQRLVPEQSVGRDQLRGFVLLPVQTAVQFGEEEVDLVRRLLFDRVELKHLHDLLQGLVAGSQFGHGESGGDADGGHENVVPRRLAQGQLFVQRQGEAAVGLGQLPHSGVGGLREHFGLLGRVLGGLRIGAPVDAAGLQREVFGFGAADVRKPGDRERRQRRHKHQPVSSPHPEQVV